MPDPAAAEDPLAARSDRLFRLFGWYLRWYFRRNFNAVRVSRTGLPQLPTGRPVIICTNHPSWWDPALFILLSVTLLRDRRGFGPMDAEALTKYALLRRMGVFGIRLDSQAGAARFLEVSQRVLSAPDTALWITAEGHFTDSRQRPLRLQPGIAHLARRGEGVTIVPLAVEYGFWNERHPEALVRFGPPIEGGRNLNIATWTDLLETALTETMDVLAQESMTRNPALFIPLLRGTGGIGGVYDLWRRSRAASAGRRFDVHHEPEKS